MSTALWYVAITGTQCIIDGAWEGLHLQALLLSVSREASPKKGRDETCNELKRQIFYIFVEYLHPLTVVVVVNK